MDHRSMHGTKWLQELLNNKLDTKLKALKRCRTLNKKTWMPTHNYFSSSKLLPSCNGLEQKPTENFSPQTNTAH